MSKAWINKSSEHNEIHQSFIETQNQCPLCGTEVTIEVSKDDSPNLDETRLREQAFCPTCNMKTRQKEYTMH